MGEPVARGGIAPGALDAPGALGAWNGQHCLHPPRGPLARERLGANAPRPSGRRELPVAAQAQSSLAG
jgi:hypothetical protein